MISKVIDRCRLADRYFLPPVRSQHHGLARDATAMQHPRSSLRAHSA